MTVESERESSDPSNRNRSVPSQTTAQDKSIQEEGDPQALRYRADSLLDEMMFGAVDVSAADSNGKADLSDSSDRSQPEQNSAYSDSSDGSDRQGSPGAGYSVSDRNASSGLESDSFASQFEHADRGEYIPAYRMFGSGADPEEDLSQRNGHDAETPAAQPTPTPEWRVKSGSGSSRGGDAVWNDYVDSFRSPGAATGQIQKWQPDPSFGYGAADRESSSSSGNGGSTSSESVHTMNGLESGSRSVENREDRDRGYVSAMAVMPSGPRRSSLLPRMSRFDADALAREIGELNEEIRSLLPVGHDQAERARHLLDKANTIAQSDPQRSAEVEYYMQQVRTIVDRTRQARRWSNLYRDRLRLYLLAWTLLSAMVLTALLLFQFQVEGYVAVVMNAVEDGLFMRNFAGALGSMMAGALGGALGALINMRRHSRTQYGFFDRKYGLRGLMLPIIGALVGVILYAVFGIVYAFAGINPSLSAVAMAIPAVIAFFFGFGQESIYGTRG